MPSTPDRRFRFGLIGCCLVALVLRISHVIATQVVPTSLQPLGDAEGYLGWASQISGGEWYGRQAFYQAPLYPYFLAIVSMAFGKSITIIRMVQSVLGVLSVALLGEATKRWLGWRIGLVSAAGLAIYPPAIYYDGIIQKASLASFLLCGLIALLAWLDNRRPRWLVAIAGVTLALLALTRENAILWIPLLAAWLLLRRVEDHVPAWQPKRWRFDKHRALDVAAFALGLGLIFFPVAARNASLGGQWSPTTVQSGPNFYIGNGADANGVYRALVPGHETPFFERGDAHRLAEQATGRDLSDRQVSRYWMRKAWSEIATDPVRWLNLMLTKGLMTINAYEVPDVESIRVYGLYSPVLRVLHPIWNFGWLFPLAVVGVWIDRRSTTRRLPAVLLWLAASMIGAVALFFILGRYRFPLVPLLMPIAAFGVVQLVHSIRVRTIWWPSIVCLIVAALVCRIPVNDVRTMESTSLMNAGISAARLDQMNEALRFFRIASQATPEIAETRLNYGKALLKLNRLDAALKELAVAKQLQPDLAFVDRLLGEVLAKQGKLNEALAFYQLALQSDPADEQVQSMIEQLQAVLERQP